MQINDDYVVGLFLVPILDADADAVWVRKIAVLATRDSVLTVDDTPQGRPPLSLDRLARRLRSCADRRPGTLIYLMVDEIAWAFTRLAEGFGAEVNEIEDALDESHPHSAADAEWCRKRLQQFRSDLHDVRAALSPTAEAVRFIVGGEDLAGEELFPPDVEQKLRDTHDRLRYVAETLDVVRNDLSGLRDYLQTRIANEQNEIMKTLTIVAALVLIPTFVVGSYGQNFDDIPGIHDGPGAFWTVVAVMMVLVSLELYYLWHRGWIGRRRPKVGKR